MNQSPPPMNRRYALVNDPIFYITLVIFVLLTTALPAIIGQPIFLPIAQSLALFSFMMITLYQHLVRRTLIVIALWLVLQFLVIVLATIFAEQRIQAAIPDGFHYRMAYAEWFYSSAGAVRPDSFAAHPVARTVEVLGVTLGSLLSVGLVGLWFLMRALNLAAFSMGSLLLAIGDTGGFLGAIPLWSLVRISGYAGLIVCFTEPLLTNDWQLWTYLRKRRRLLLTAIGLTAGGMVLELFLPSLWRAIFQ
ncbi:MAG: hypothetical protein R2932_03170 [Caldilineaceae bacterium]